MVSEYGLDILRGESPVDYKEVFDLLAKMDPSERVHRPKESIAVALEYVKPIKGNRWHLVFVRGTHDEIPVLLNAASGRSEIQELGENQFVAYRTHMVISLHKKHRLVLLEYSHYGAKSGEVAGLFGHLLTLATKKEHTVSLKPQFAKSFAQEVRKFNRILEASATIAVPNPGWGDADGLLADLGGKSAAGRIGIHANARQGESLSKADGLVKEILDQSPGNGLIESAFVVGRRPGEEKNIRLSLQNFAKKIGLLVRRDGRTGVDSNDLLGKMDERMTYLEEEKDE